ncbi:MAG: hypothetical protein MK106_11100 [Mariniblastus sp.]|nr:hypothetical protein [Mariniblastus sp.]
MIQIDLDRLSQIKRVNVIGTSGSGKSTFSQALAELLELPYIEMDRLYWGPQWAETADEIFFPKVEAVTEQANWVLDGNYSQTTSIKWRQVQLVVWLDLSFYRTLCRVTGRCVKRSLKKTEIWPETGNRETLGKAFLSRESVILWAITSYWRNRRRYARVINAREYASIWFVRLRSPVEVDTFLFHARKAKENR